MAGQALNSTGWTVVRMFISNEFCIDHDVETIKLLLFIEVR